jgi:DNA mismatch repair protein MutS2
VGPGNSIKSSASPELQRVRKELSRKRDNLRAKLESYINQGNMGGVFSDQVVTQRADRFVVPVRSDSKGKVQGILHDTSGSGATCFMEPLDAVEDNNQLSMLRNKEREEEIKVLREVARELSLNLQVLYENQETLAKLDCLLAQARFAQKLDAVEPRLGNTYEMELTQARHPLLAWRALSRHTQVVPIDIALGRGSDVLMISGANAGGKTVTLKTVGLITLMVMCGMHVTCQKGSLVSIFQQVAAELSDEQDLNEALSTFTAHARRLAWMTRNATKESLFLIDEIGGGTDPGEGAALAMAIIDRLKRLKAKVIATTHFHRLKAYAALTSGIENVSVTFDPDSGKATYRLHYGAPGLSDALAVSAGLGFPESVLRRANSYMDESEKQTIALLRQAQKDRRLAKEELAQAKAHALTAQEDKQKARELLKTARKERQGALAEGKRKVREVARRMEGMLKDLLGEIEEKKNSGKSLLPGAEKQKLYKARRDALAKVEEVLSGQEDKELKTAIPATPSKETGKLVKQARVKVASLGQTGTLLEDPDPDAQTVLVSVGVRGVRVRVSMADLEPLGKAADKKESNSAPRRVSVRADAGDGLDLKVIGCTVDEAIPMVDKALDQALLAGRARLRVVHGMGTGRLKAAVRRYLSDHPCVLSTRNESVKMGGGGVTVAELRE